MQRTRIRRRATRANTRGPRGGKRTTSTRVVKGRNGGMYRVTTERDSRGRKLSEKRVYLGAS